MDAKKTDAFTPDDRAAERERIMGIYRSPSKLTAAPAAPRGPLSQEDRIAGLILEAQKRAPPAGARPSPYVPTHKLRLRSGLSSLCVS